MFQVTILGNLGADAEVRTQDGRNFVTFRVAHTRRFQRQGQPVEETTWFSCILNGDGGELRKYLVKGQTVLVIGDGTTRIYSSPKLHRMVASVDINVRSVELVGRPSNDIPRQLADPSGVLHEVHKAYYIALNEANEVLGGLKSNPLYDARGNAYELWAGGWVTPRQQAVDASAEAAGAQFEPEAEPQQAGPIQFASDNNEQAPVDDLPFTGDAAPEAVATANKRGSRNANKNS